MTKSERTSAVRRWSVGRYTAELVIPTNTDGLQCAYVEWSPRQPDRLTAEEMEQYRTGRNAAVRSLAAELGLTAAILEI